jgi:hypothetical protein
VELRNIKFHENRFSCYTDSRQDEANRRIFAAFYCEHNKNRKKERKKEKEFSLTLREKGKKLVSAKLFRNQGLERLPSLSETRLYGLW